MTAHLVARQVAAHGLGRAPEPMAPAEGEWRRILMEIEDQRLSGLAVEAAEIWLDIDARQYSQLIQRHQSAMLWSLHIERTLLELDEAFREAGVEYLVLKGPALAHTAFVAPEDRPFGDLDLLVAADSWMAASQVAESLGFARKRAELRDGFVDAFGKCLVHVGPEGLEIDLHRRLVGGPHGLRSDPAELFARRSSFVLGGISVPRLDDTSAFVHACMHAVLGNITPRLMALRDVLQIAGRLDVDWTRAAEQISRWELSTVVRHAVATATEVLGITAPKELAARVSALAVPSRRELRWLRAYSTPRRHRGATSLAAIGAVPGLRPKVSYLRAVGLPSREFLAARQNGRASHLKRWITPLTGGNRKAL
jgi:hypothetical protein